MTREITKVLQKAKEYDDYDYPGDDKPTQGVTYSKSHNVYMINSDRTRQLCTFKVTKDEFFKIRAGHIKDFYPKFDAKKHVWSTYYGWDYIIHNDHNHIVIKEKNVKDADTELPFGYYKITTVDHEFCLQPVTINSNKYIDIGRTTSSMIYEDFTTWRTRRDAFEKEGQLHKSGIFMFGPPGNGKTMEIVKLLSNTNNDKFHAILIGSKTKLFALNDFKELFKGKDVVIVLEEITERLENDSIEEILTFLDGQDSWNNCYIIATTNYPEKLAPNMVDRPGRFRKIIEVTYPTDPQKTKYLKARDVDDKSIKIILEFTSNKFSLDYIREIVNIHKTTGVDYPTIIADIKTTRKKVSSTFKGSLGLRQ